MLVAIPVLAVAGDLEGASPPVPVSGLPPRVATAYQQATVTAGCPGLRWELLAGIGWVESRHGTGKRSAIDPETGEAKPWIFGPVLDGRAGTLALPIGPWSGWWGLEGSWQRAVGPMQFLPGTFTGAATDGDADGTLNPHDLDDAAATAARYLCGSDGRVDDEREALRRYNASSAYAIDVLAYADGLAGAASGAGGPIACPVAGKTSFTDTWHAPRPGGRVHLGVDMFAVRGTPVVAPVAGVVDHADNSVGGLSFVLWGDDGTYYYGAHLHSHAAATGHVAAGTVVGYVGNTGNAVGTSPHLHFEIHPGRRPGDPSSPVNPTGVVAQACAATRVGYGLLGGE